MFINIFVFFSKFVKYDHMIDHDDTRMERQKCLISLTTEVREKAVIKVCM